MRYVLSEIENMKMAEQFAEGITTKAIAQSLYITEGAVRARMRILRKRENCVSDIMLVAKLIKQRRIKPTIVFTARAKVLKNY